MFAVDAELTGPRARERPELPACQGGAQIRAFEANL
jgi:hypothetical protein